MRRVGSAALVSSLLCLRSVSALPSDAFVNFEAKQINPIRLSPDGSHLFVANTEDARLSVFDISNPTSPALEAEVVVGLEPVSVNARNDDEVWVVNEVSDSVSVVSVSRGLVLDTIYVNDEPADVVFAAGRAFVSVAGRNQVRVFDGSSRAPLATLALSGLQPRALAVDPAGTRVYAAFFASGNATTIVPFAQAPPQPPPTNGALPAPPQVAAIVGADDPAWSPSVIGYSMPDNDVAVIDVASLAVVGYHRHVGTTNFALAVRPSTGDLYVANTDARNLVRFEPNLRGHVVENQVTRVDVATGVVTKFDLNPGIDHAVLPNPAALQTALAQPTAVAFEPSGSSFYVAAFGTDRVARLDASGNVLSRIAIGNAGSPREKRGPRGLALNGATGYLYVLNRISNTVAVVDTATDAVVGEVAVGQFDPTPVAVRSGRGFLYDAKLSGNGTVSCASCHIDADFDYLAWDLGDRGGAMQTVSAPMAGLPPNPTQSFTMHPMKGPMTTQTLKGLAGLEPFHWRGDRADFAAFNPAFASLLGGSALPAADMLAFVDFIDSVVPSPNPNQNLDRSLPTSFAGGNPSAGLALFGAQAYVDSQFCITCHTPPPAAGTDRTLMLSSSLAQSQSIKVPQLRNLYQKAFLDTAVGATSLAGFGFGHDGTFAKLFQFLGQGRFSFIRNNASIKNNLSAFLMCFDTGMAPAVGYARTVTEENIGIPAVLQDLALLEGQASSGNVDLIVKGTLGGVLHGLVYQPASALYLPDDEVLGTRTRAQLDASVAAGDTLTFLGVPPGTGFRMGVDRDLDGVRDASSSVPVPVTGRWSWFAMALSLLCVGASVAARRRRPLPTGR